jgi:hypothetical protein
MDWKNKAKSQFSERRKPETLVAIPVPEWETTVYYWPDMTLAERREIFLLAKQDGDSTVLDLEAMAVTLLVRARDKNGKRIFVNAERRELLNEYDPEVMAGIVAAMSNGTVSVEDAEKK